ncbi:hypothetical protein LCGC14_1131580 [marine sediment metagenome]|uniref:Uncharacterized protein n=1 Tax=marine sediment metagenome TaxID=412755 RepID=A0A0F9MNP9_9ZZZZ
MKKIMLLLLLIFIPRVVAADRTQQQLYDDATVVAEFDTAEGLYYDSGPLGLTGSQFASGTSLETSDPISGDGFARFLDGNPSDRIDWGLGIPGSNGIGPYGSYSVSVWIRRTFDSDQQYFMGNQYGGPPADNDNFWRFRVDNINPGNTYWHHQGNTALFYSPATDIWSTWVHICISANQSGVGILNRQLSVNGTPVLGETDSITSESNGPYNISIGGSPGDSVNRGIKGDIDAFYFC